MHIKAINRIVDYAQATDLGLLGITNAPIIDQKKY